MCRGWSRAWSGRTGGRWNCCRTYVGGLADWCRAMMGYGACRGPGAVAGRVAGPAMRGVVSRPGLFERLGGPARVTVVAAGSGKTVLLRSWMSAARLAGHAAWVPVGREERDPQWFWISVADALRG